MTAQVSDSIWYKQMDFVICGINGNGLYEPATDGFEPVPMSTACWRGYVLDYEISEQLLLLKKMKICLTTPPPFPTCCGVAATPVKRRCKLCTKLHLNTERCVESSSNSSGAGSFGGTIVYENISWTVPFTGTLLLGDDFVRELYVHMGFHPAWKYRRVLKGHFNSGRLQNLEDLSEQAEVIRAKLSRSGQPNGAPNPLTTDSHKIEQWIKSTFERSCDL